MWPVALGWTDRATDTKVMLSRSGSTAIVQHASDADCEVLIAGGGMVGLTLGLSLARAGLSVILVDQADPSALRDDSADGRASAIARGSQQILDAVGLWAALAPVAQPILDIRVSDASPGAAASHLFLHYDHREADGRPLGYLVENRLIRRALASAVEGQERLTVLAPRRVSHVGRGMAAVEVGLDRGETITARLIVGADGRRSFLRQSAGIPVVAWDYPQTGIVATVQHAQPHRGVAHENFLPSGPFAMLPLVDDEQGRHRSSIVWTERRELAPTLLALNDERFSREIERRFGASLGAIAVTGQRWFYPLSLSHAERYCDHRLALVGDAAHAIHPIAGQGLNLGLRDLAALAEVVVDAWRLGLDPGSLAVLRGYERWRRLDSLLLIAATDGLNRLFSNRLAPLRLARDLGLAAVDRAPGIKRLLMRHAMGLVGDIPRLARGESL